MAKVNTVLGPMDTADMGVTLMHEHVLGSSIAIPQIYPEILDKGYMTRCIRGLKEAKAGGNGQRAGRIG